MTFYDLLCQNINEYKDIENFTDFISRYYKGNVDNYDMVKYKQSDEIIKDIDSYINNLLSTIKFNNKLEYDNFIEIDTEELNNMLNYKYNRFPLFERIKEMSKRIASNNYEGSTKNASSIEKKLKELLNIKLDLKDIFNNFYQSKYSKYKDKVNDKYLYYEDACIFLYIKSLLVGFNTNHVIKEIVIDEAQDFTEHELRKTLTRCHDSTKVVVCGNIIQTDLKYKQDSGLLKFIEAARREDFIKICKLT